MTYSKKFILQCVRDHNWHFRKVIAKFFKPIIEKLTKEIFQSTFYEDLIDLLNDEDIMVRLEAIDDLVEIMNIKLNVD